MAPTRLADLALGPAAIGWLIPHRTPFLLVERTVGFGTRPAPRLVACKGVDADDPVLRGHFPGAPLWPGVLTIEGLAQTCGILAALDQLVRTPHGPEASPDTVLQRLAEESATAELGADPPAWVSAALRRGASPLLADVTVKLKGTVTAGDTLRYEVSVERVVDDMMRFAVCAVVDARVVAEGRLMTYVRGREGGDA